MISDPQEFFDAVVTAYRDARTEFYEDMLDISPDDRIRATTVGLMARYNQGQLAVLTAVAIDRIGAPAEGPKS
jgi:hypothetical protein